jgi:hypothetical protein
MFDPSIINLYIHRRIGNKNLMNKCIIGFKNLLYMNGVNPYFKYDMGIDGIVNGSHNSPSPHFTSIISLCFTNY